MKRIVEMIKSVSLPSPQQTTRNRSVLSGSSSTRLTGSTVLLIDCSYSMDGQKLREAKAAASTYVTEAEREGHAVALVGFGTQAERITPFGASPQQVAAALAALQTSGSTNMTAALTLAGQLLSGASPTLSIVVITDGMPNNSQTALSEGTRLKAQGIAIHTVSIPTADDAFLAQLAGEPTRVTKLASASELPEALRTVARRLLLPPSDQR